MKMDVDKLKKAVKKTGFLAELEAGRCFLENKWDVRQNFYYIDKAEKKERELDILATSLVRPIDYKSYQVSLSLFCDVKKITDNKAWVIFSTKQNQHDQKIDFLKTISKLLKSKNIEIAKNVLRQRQEYPRIGRTYSVISENGQYGEDQIFTAIKASTKALKYYYWIESQSNNITGNKNIRNKIILKIMEPLIILKGSLYEIYLNEQNKECYEERKSLIIAYNNICDNVIAENYLIEIVTIDELENFLKEKKRWLQFLANDIFD